jgi:hypothetical protein
VTTGDAFISVLGPTSGSGPATVRLAVAPNSGAARQGTVVIAGKTFVVQQSAADVPCAFSVSPSSIAAPAAGVSVPIAVTMTQGVDCHWTAVVSSGPATLSGAPSGIGSGGFNLVFGPNSSYAWSATLTVGGKVVAVSQEGVARGCTFSFSPDKFNVPAAGQTIAMTVTPSAASCSWTATVPPWMKILSGASGTGPGTVTVEVSANTGPARSDGGITVNSLSTAVLQAAGPNCVALLDPTSQTVLADGTSLPIAVTTLASCSWAPSTAATFLSPTASATSGSGTVALHVSPNTTSSQRTATISIGGKTTTITQLAAGATTPVAVFSYRSDPNDAVGRGASSILTVVGSQITPTFEAGKQQVSFNLATGLANLRFAAPAGGTLGAGFFDNALRTPWSSGSPVLDVSIGGYGCNTASGRMLVAEAVISDNVVQRFHAVFEQHCNYASPALIGDFWYDRAGSTSVPPAPPLPQAATPPSTFLSLTGDAGNFILDGQSRNFTTSTATFSAHTLNVGSGRLDIFVDGATSQWSLFVGGANGQLIQPGTYTTQRMSSATAAGLDLSGEHRGCNASTGTLTVLEVVYNADAVLRFHATFTQTCADGGSAGSVRGEIYIVADPWRFAASAGHQPLLRIVPEP